MSPSPSRACATEQNKHGKIFLVGLGPGSEQHMTARAREAIAQSDVVIGYSTYIKLVSELLAGKQVVRKGMTEELDRCHEALSAAREGKAVALVSSGDSGVYGMAGPTFEVLFESGWQPGDGVDVEVVPGSSAINSCAALVGAPLTHDFCSISLSDLLTPWPVIAGRLQAAARGDFVVALYNPKSGRRTGQIVEAQRILLQHRNPATPVALVKSGYRRRQSIQLTRLDQMAECDIGMLTTVLIGNSNTFVRHGLMVTPRGYANKYDTDGAVQESRARERVHDGEQAGRSLSMGLLGWHEYVRAFLQEKTERTLRDAAAHFRMPLAEILAAVSHVTTDSAPGDWQSAQVLPQALDDLLGWTQDWGPLRAVVRADSGSVAELLLDGDAFTWGEPAQPAASRWLNLVTPHFHLHVNWSNVTQGWLVGHSGDLHSACFLDHTGAQVFSLQPRSVSGAFHFACPFDRAELALRLPLQAAAMPAADVEEVGTDE